jgi:catechol 2,3-dioxygenase-like lactoylglutathione lyase family enzyme
MKRVTGIGGIFFKASDPERLYAWYEKHLGLKGNPGEGIVFHWPDPEERGKSGTTVFAIFPRDTAYFQPGRGDFMINFRVNDLDGLLADLRANGVEVDPRRENYEYGRFAWIMDPEGNRIELWEPPAGK